MMKTLTSTLLFLVMSLSCTLAQQSQQQHPLVGTWEMISISGVNADGEKFYLDTTTVRETKIITPTHYMLIATDRENGKWTFNRCYAGTVKMEGPKYYETPLLSSLRIFDNVSSDFHWKIEGDRFTQSGSITRPDGKKVIIHEFIFQKAKNSGAQNRQHETGTWQLAPTHRGQKGLLVITPTHWMAIFKNGDKFNKAMGGTITDSGKDLQAITDLTSEASSKKTVLIKMEGKKVQLDSVTFDKVYQGL
jgi:hypothetical protein